MRGSPVVARTEGAWAERARGQASYHVRMRGFEGPFDVLLRLVMRQQVDIMDIDLARLTRDYLDYLEERRDVGLELTTEFLQVAALLLAIKASVLGVEDEGEGELPETAGELLARLKELATFKAAAARLRALIEERSRYGTRAREAERPRRVRVARVRPDALRAAYLRARARTVPASRSSHIILDSFQLERALELLRSVAADAGVWRFSELWRRAGSPAMGVRLLYALLLLAQEGGVAMEQEEPLGEIVVSFAGVPERFGR